MADQEIALTKFEVKMRFKMDAADVVQNLQPEEVLDLISEMDNEVGLWAHTLLLYRHFLKQFEVAKEKCPELVELTDDQLLLELHGECDETPEAVTGG